MPLRSGGRFSKAKRGELDKIHALLPLLRPLLQSGSLRSVLETAAGSAALAPTPPGKGVQRQKEEVVEEGWKRVRHSKRTKVDQPPPRDTLQQDGWSVRVEHSLAGFHRAKEGIFMASVKEAKELMAEMHSNGSLAVLVPINVNEKGTEISVLVQEWNGCMQSRQRFLHQLGDIPVQYQSTAPQGGNVKHGGTKQIVLSLSKQYNTQANKVGKRRNSYRESQRDDDCCTEQVWKCAPSDAHCWTRRIASCCPMGHCLQGERTA